ncbi:MAG: AzlC family ABC transporter permease [Lachnospiraceae bacterium]|nr:AzlC family ABC transporter permease [Lachnospiraceae bacterium]
MKDNKQWYLQGIKDGIPIALGYFVVSFTLGIIARNIGINALEATIISFTNNASAGEKIAFEVIAADSGFIAMAIATLTTNLRYLLMSCALSQKISPKTPFFHRLLIAYDVTDEIFGISIAAPGYLNPFYSYGAMTVALPGWALGTGFGVICGNIMPARLLVALSVALYGMFIAVVIPPTKKNKVLAAVVPISMIVSAIFTFAPVLKEIDSGYRTIILTIVISLIAALLFPVKEETKDNQSTVAD